MYFLTAAGKLSKPPLRYVSLPYCCTVLKPSLSINSSFHSIPIPKPLIPISLVDAVFARVTQLSSSP